MKKQKVPVISETVKQFHCSLLMAELKERLKKLKAYGVPAKDIIPMLMEENDLPLLIVTKDYKLVLSGMENVTIEMEPLTKAVYLLFLKHPEGIAFKELPDYRDELLELYAKIRTNGINDRVVKSIEDVTNPLLNSINEKCSRIKAAFQNAMDASLADQYYITGKSGEKKRVVLSRELVVWEE